MKLTIPETEAPRDATERKAVQPVVCYPIDTLPKPDLTALRARRSAMVLQSETRAEPRQAVCFEVKAGQTFRIVSVEGSQVGDLNLHALNNLDERFYSGKTRALHGTHVSTGDQLWSSFPYMRPMATIIADTLDWYGFDEFGGSVHDVIGTRCDPYTNNVLSGGQYHHCCHSNLVRALAEHTGKSAREVEPLVHDVLNVFMCTGFTQDTHQYFMKASPVRPGDYIEFYAEIDLLGVLSACPGGDCSSEHSSDVVTCYPLGVEIYGDGSNVSEAPLNAYDRSHGL